MSKSRMNIVYGEKYGDVNDPKTRWTKVGTLFTDDDDGRQSIKLDAVPVGKLFDGWLAVFPIRDYDAKGDGQDQVHGDAPTSGDTALATGKGSDDGSDKPIDLSEIPF